MKKFFLALLGIVVIAIAFLVGYDLVFGEGALINTVWDAVRSVINGFWQGITGSDTDLIQEFNPDNDGSGGSQQIDNPFGG